LLLIQDAVIACATPLWSVLLLGIEVYVLQDDLMARGLINQTGLVVDMEGYVNLVVEYNSPLCW
jgi:sulfur relay protein TusB/DsrH